MEIHIADDKLDPIQTLEKKERIELLRDVVSKMKPKYRELVELRYFEEKSYDEIAEELDRSLGTVKAQLHRARRPWKRCWGRCAKPSERGLPDVYSGARTRRWSNSESSRPFTPSGTRPSM